MNPTAASLILSVFLVSAGFCAEPSNIQKDLEFATVEGQSLKLDLYLPTEVEDPYLVVWIHGGAEFYKVARRERNGLRDGRATRKW